MRHCWHASSSGSACREPVIVAIWGLETDFGTGSGKRPAIPALATLAHDCRRSGMFQGELLAALRIIDRGDMSAAEMRGAWAGELGQTQFLPSSYLKFAVDFDGNGRRDLIRSVPDVLASTANYLKGYGWQRGAAVDRGHAQFRGPQGVEQGGGLSEDDRAVRIAAFGVTPRRSLTEPLAEA